ncbi:hypothetical protein WDU94_015377 [Cyamophila willieti]
MIRMKNGSTKCGLDMGDGLIAEATGLIFIKATKDPWIRSLSRSHNKKYYNNPMTKVSTYDLVPEASASFTECMKNRRLWTWEFGCGMKGDDATSEKVVLHKHQLCSVIQEKNKK